MGSNFTFEHLGVTKTLGIDITWQQLKAPTKEGIAESEIDGENYKVMVTEQNIKDHSMNPSWPLQIFSAGPSSHYMPEDVNYDYVVQIIKPGS